MSEATSSDFWQALDTLVATHALVIDRPRGTRHPRYPESVYPLDYGYLEGTHAGDGGGIDIWVGTQPERRVTAVVVTVDLLKRDAEIKILLACSPSEQQTILALHQHSARTQSALLLERAQGACLS